MNEPHKMNDEFVRLECGSFVHVIGEYFQHNFIIDS